jgi:archaellum biogenesis protein FlaJ (TadC family)
MKKDRNAIWKLRKDKRASPLIEEGILIGLALFAFVLLVAIVSDILGFTQDIFQDVSDKLRNLAP